MLNKFFSYRNTLFLIYAAGGILLLAAHSLILYKAGFSFRVALIDSSVSNALLFLVCSAISVTLRYYQPDKNNVLKLLPWGFVLAGIWMALVKITLIYFLKQDSIYALFLEKTILLRYCFAFLMIGWVMFLNWIWYYIKAQQETTYRRNEAEKLSKETELVNLQQKLQPHFLFNSLNSIHTLIGSEPKQARNMVLQLSDFLRGTVKKTNQQLVPLSEELEHLQLYLDIEKVRFGHRLSIVVDTNQELLKYKLPSLLLQPIVENAIKFGLYDTTGEITIRIVAKFENDFLEIKVENPFDESTAASHKGTGFGLSSISRRLYLLYARQDLLQMQSHKNIFTTTVKIPQLLAHESNNN